MSRGLGTVKKKEGAKATVVNVEKAEMKDGTTVAFEAAIKAMEERGIKGLPTDAVVAFAYLDGDGAPQLAMYVTELIHATLGLATWLRSEMLEQFFKSSGE